MICVLCCFSLHKLVCPICRAVITGKLDVKEDTVVHMPVTVGPAPARARLWQEASHDADE